MIPETGEVQQFTAELYEAEQKRRCSQGLKPLVPVRKAPDPKCYKCHGTGSVLIGEKRKRYRPCRCTNQ